MAAPGFFSPTPKEESAYDKKIREAQEKAMDDCCEGMSYRPSGYAPRSKPAAESNTVDSPVDTSAVNNEPVTDQKNRKR